MSSVANWFRPEMPPMGVEFSNSSVKTIAFRRNRKNIELAFHDYRLIPPGAVEEGVIQDAAAVSRVLAAMRSAAEKKLGSVPPAVVSLSEEQTFLQILNVPAIGDRKKLAEAVRWEAAGTIPQSIDEVVLDFAPLPSNNRKKPHRDVLVGTAPIAYVSAVRSMFEDAGFHLAALDLESLAIMRSLLSPGNGRKPTLIADIGGSGTTFVIVAGDAVLLTSTVGVGITLMKEALQRELSLDEKEAGHYLGKVGIAGKNRRKLSKKKKKTIKEDDILDVLLPILTDLNQQIREYLSYYRTHAEHAHTAARSIQEVIVTGSGATIQGLPEYLALQLRLPVRHGDPWAGARARGMATVPDLSFNDSLSFTTAIGLAIHSL